jgi:hypothetical protein
VDLLVDRPTPDLIDFYGRYFPGLAFVVGRRPGRNRSLARCVCPEYLNGVANDRGARIARERSVAGQVEGQRFRRAAGVGRDRVAITRALTADSSLWCAMRSALHSAYPCKSCSICSRWAHALSKSRVLAPSSRALRIACSPCPMVRSARPLPSGAVLAAEAMDTHNGLLTAASELEYASCV